MRPVLRGMIPYTALKDCSVDLGDIADMNEALDVEQANNEILMNRARVNGN